MTPTTPAGRPEPVQFYLDDGIIRSTDGQWCQPATPIELDLFRRIAELEAELDYYSASRRGRLPKWVPSRVHLPLEVFGDPPFRGAGVAAGDHDCQCNQHGAVSVVDRGGKLLGLRPAEFTVLAWSLASRTIPPAQGEVV